MMSGGWCGCLIRLINSMMMIMMMMIVIMAINKSQNNRSNSSSNSTAQQSTTERTLTLLTQWQKLKCREIFEPHEWWCGYGFWIVLIRIVLISINNFLDLLFCVYVNKRFAPLRHNSLIHARRNPFISQECANEMQLFDGVTYVSALFRITNWESIIIIIRFCSFHTEWRSAVYSFLLLDLVLFLVLLLSLLLLLSAHSAYRLIQSCGRWVDRCRSRCRLSQPGK